MIGAECCDAGFIDGLGHETLTELLAVHALRKQHTKMDMQVPGGTAA